MTKSTNVLCTYDQSDDGVARKGAFDVGGRADEHIIEESAPNEPKLGGGA